jgi:predicted nucleotidyltransferase
MSAHIPIDRQAISAFCARWQVEQFALFGSVVRDDFGPDSDVDVLVRFAPEARVTGIDFARMEAELRVLFGRPVDLVSRRGVEQSRSIHRRASILETAEVIYDVAA